MEPNVVIQTNNTQTAGQENNTVTIQPDAQQTQTQVNQQPAQSSDNDILSRVNRMQQNVKPVEGDDVFDYKELEKIQDPTLREQAVKMYKTFQRGFNNKYQELASLKKQLQEQTHSGAGDIWTPERVQQAMQNPSFLQSAQSVLSSSNQSDGQMSSEEWSTLTESEKLQFKQMQQQIKTVSQQNSQLIRQQQDERLKTKYATYSPVVIDDLVNQLLNGRYQATREDLWKVYDYENAVKRAYQLGKDDRQLEITEKVESNTTLGNATMQSADDVPAKLPNESGFNYFRRLAQRRLAQSQGSVVKR